MDNWLQAKWKSIRLKMAASRDGLADFVIGENLMITEQEWQQECRGGRDKMLRLENYYVHAAHW